MNLIQVENKAEEKLFIQVPLVIYKNDPNWIRPLDQDIYEVFDQKKNKSFRFGKIIRWVLKDDNGNLIGRIAAFTNKKYKNKDDEVAAGGIGFFECINDQEAADLLFNNAKHWLIKEKVEAMDGPINFGERDKWWGLLVEGFSEPLYGMNYNPPYYKEMYENYGFKVFYNQLCFGLNPKAPVQNRVVQRHQLIAEKQEYVVKYVNKNNLEKYSNDFTEVYNKAWASHGGMKSLTKEQVLIMFKKMKLVMDPKAIWFAYHHERPIAMFINLPDLNQWFKYMKGKFHLLNKLYFLYLKKFKPNHKLTGLVFGVDPEYQGIGIDAFLIAESSKMLQSGEMPYTDYEMQWIGDFNPKMIKIAEKLGDTFISRKLATYRYLFDQSQTFKRHPNL
jgi:hypothetical protein